MRKIYLLLCVVAISLLSATKSFSQITVTATAGVLGPTVYTTLFNAVTAVNAGTHQGNITMTVTANTTEVSQSILNSSGTGAASYTSILIKPAAAATPTIQGTIVPAIFQLRGADNVTIDGSNTAGGTSRDLTIRNNSAAAAETVFWLSSASAADGATNNTIKNCNIQGVLSGLSTTVAGILFGNTGTIGTAPVAGNSNNTIKNNAFTNLQNGIYHWGYATAPYDANITISGNSFSSLIFRGMIMQNCSNLTINNNSISGITVATGSTPTGIMLYGSYSVGNIYNNSISSVNNSAATYGCNGIWLYTNTAASGLNVYNNMIKNIWSTTGGASTTFSFNGYGICITPLTAASSGFNLYYNTIDLNTTSTGGAMTAAINVEAGMPAGAINLKDNILSNTQASGATTRTGIYSSSASTVFASTDFNCYTSTSGSLGFIGGVSRTTIAQIQTGFGGNVNSITLTPTYMSATDLHLQLVAGNVALIAGTPIAAPSITTDIDSDPRSAATPTIGADELPPVQIVYTSLTSTCSTGDITLSGVSITSLAGVPTSGALVPRIYFRKGAGTWYSAAGTLTAGTGTSGTWSFTITAATMGGVAGGDVISYYVIAQTVGGSVVANPGAGLVATDVNTVTTHPTTPNNYTINAVSLTGLTTNQSVCYNGSAATSASYSYTGSAGAPNQYSLSWSPAGPTNVPASTPLPASPIAVNVPATTAVGTYTGTLTVTNSTTTCANTYTITLTVNPLPNAITGTAITCVGLTTTLASSTPGGAWSATPTSTATVGASNGVVTGIATGTATVTYTIPTTCYTTTVVTVSTPPAAITGTGVVCVGATTALSNSVPGGTWTSANISIATAASATGIITGAAGGTAVISYNLSSCPPATTVVTVNPVPSAIGGPLGVCQGATTTLTEATPGGAWSSSTPTVATISSTGVVTTVITGSSIGTTTITYQLTTTGCFRTAVVTVYPTPVPIDGPDAICIGSTQSMTNLYGGGTWVSTNTSVATIGLSSGLITGVAFGTTNVIYTLGGSCNVNKIVSVSIAPSAISGPSVVCTGKTITLTNTTSGGTWASSAPATATVSTVGIVTGVNPGIVTISDSTPGCTMATKLVTVNINPAVITGTTNLCEGSSTTLSNSTSGGTWTSSNPLVPVSPTGVVSGLGVGVLTTISYTLPNGCFSTAPIVVDSLPDPIIGADSICQGSVTTLTNVTGGGIWSSSDGTKASIIAASGVTTGLLPGSVTISYTLVSGCYVTKPFKVRTPLPAAVTIQRIPDTNYCAGTSVMFIAHPTNGGVHPTYRWQKFTVDTAVGDTFTYVPVHGDYISVYMNVDSICAAPNPAHAFVYNNVYPNNVTPSVTITTTKVPNVISFLGEVVTFHSDVTFGGTSPTYQWYVNDVAVPGATNSSYTLEVYRSIVVYCKVTGNPPCSSGTAGTSNTIIIYALDGVNSLAVGSAEFSLFPNPNTGAFTLNGTITNGADEELTIEVTNMLGQIVYRGAAMPQNGKVDQQVILGNDLAAGSYLMRVSAGAVNQTFHFVISK